LIQIHEIFKLVLVFSCDEILLKCRQLSYTKFRLTGAAPTVNTALINLQIKFTYWTVQYLIFAFGAGYVSREFSLGGKHERKLTRGQRYC
jgi:hypothetical protein